MQLLKAFWGRQASLVTLKTKSRNRFNVENAWSGGQPPLKIFSSPLEKFAGHRLKLLDTVQKNWASSQKTLFPSWCPTLVTGLCLICTLSCIELNINAFWQQTRSAFELIPAHVVCNSCCIGEVVQSVGTDSVYFINWTICSKRWKLLLDIFQSRICNFSVQVCAKVLRCVESRYWVGHFRGYSRLL